MEITYEFVRATFDYDPEGFLVWKRSLNNQFAGKRAGGVDKKGYWYIQLERFNRKVLAHRLIFLWHKGYTPPMVDHANRVKTDNRIENLREATPTQQNANKPIDPRNRIAFKGVEYDRGRNRYRAILTKNKIKYRSKRFKTPEEAHDAYIKMALDHFGEFACFG